MSPPIHRAKFISINIYNNKKMNLCQKYPLNLNLLRQIVESKVLFSNLSSLDDEQIIEKSIDRSKNKFPSK